MNRRKVIGYGLAGIGLLASSLSVFPVRAQDKYPIRPIRLILPSAPGGSTDALGRRFAFRAGALLGQNIVPDNKGGANGVIGTVEAARAKPDGYTLLYGTSSVLALNPTAMDNPPYDTVRDFAPIALLGIVPVTIAINPAVPAGTLRELIALMRANPGKYSYGSSGVGSINHLAGELFRKQVGGVDIRHIPYKGSGPSVIDLIAGQIPLLFGTFSSVDNQHKAGKLRILAVLSETRLSSTAPDIPTAIESGVPGMVAYTYGVICAPAGTPKYIIDTISRAALKVMGDTSFQKEIRDAGFEPVTDSSPEKAERFIIEEIARWAPIIKATGVKLE